MKERFAALRKKVFCVILIGLAVAALHLGDAYVHLETIDRDAFEYRSTKVSDGLDGFRIALLTDIHVRTNADMERLARAIALLEGERLDLLLLGGDFSYGDAKRAKTAYQMLSKVQTAHGVYAVLGNHDLGQSDIDSMEAYGIRCLRNDGYEIVSGLYLGGVEDLWSGKPDVQMAISGRAQGDFVLLLSHNPDVVRDFDVSGVDLMLSGHTHGGLTNLFGLWSPATRFVSKYGSRFSKGLVHDAADVFISNGLGDTKYPRIFARRHVNIITLRAK